MGVRKNIHNAWLNLNGIATPDGPHPTGRHVSVLRTKILGAAFVLTGLGTAHLFILRPLEEAKRSGVLRQNPFGLVVSIVLVYSGLAMVVFDVRDERTMRAGPDGRLRWTRRGRIFLHCMWFGVALTVIAWYLYIYSIGLSPF